MATLDQLKAALIAADKAGNVEDARTLAQAIKTAQASPTLDPTVIQSARASMVGSALQGAADPVLGTGQLLTHAAAAANDTPILGTIAKSLPFIGPAIAGLDDNAVKSADDLVKSENQSYEDARKASGSTGFDAARLAGNIASPVNLAGGEVAGNLPRALGLLRKAAQGAGVGAALGLTQPVTDDGNFGKEKAIGAGIGGVTGGIAPAIARGASSILNPTVSADVKALLDKGIRLTPGQILGGGFKGAEDKIASSPYLAPLVSSAQKTSTEDFNRSLMKSALEPIGVDFPKTVDVGRRGVDYVARKIGEVYDSSLPQMTGRFDPEFKTDLSSITSGLAGNGAAQSTIDRVMNVVKTQLLDKADANGEYSGDTLKGIQSKIGGLAAKYSSSPDADSQDLGSALQDVHGAFRDMLARNNPGQIDKLNAADAAWAQYARIRRAASMLGAKDGVFSGPQFANAVKASDKSVGKGAYAEGNAFMQDLSDPASNVLPSSVPDSGTAGRLLMASALGGGHFLPLVGPASIPLAGLMALYTKTGSKVARAALTSRPATVRALGTKAGNASVPLMSIPLVSLANALGVAQGN